MAPLTRGSLLSPAVRSLGLETLAAAGDPPEGDASAAGVERAAA